MQNIRIGIDMFCLGSSLKQRSGMSLLFVHRLGIRIEGSLQKLRERAASLLATNEVIMIRHQTVGEERHGVLR